MSADPSIPPTEAPFVSNGVGSMERSIRCLRSRNEETASNGLETASNGLARGGGSCSETLAAHWVVHRPTPSSAGRMSKERRYFEGGELFTKTVAFPTLILVAHECILHFAANSVAFLCRIPPTMPKICTKSPIGWRTSPRLFASTFFCARQSRATAIFRQHLFVARAASDAFDVRTRTRFVDEEKNRFAFGGNNGETRNNQSERTTRDWFDSGNDMIYILVLLQKLRQL